MPAEPGEPASKGGSESTVKMAKADLVPTEANLMAGYDTFAQLDAACAAFCAQVNARVRRVTRRAPVDVLAEEQARLHPLPVAPHTVALGTTRRVADKTPMVTYDGGQYSVPHTLLGQPVWVRVHGAGDVERVVTVHLGEGGPVEVARHARHARATPGSPPTTRPLPPATSRWPGDRGADRRGQGRAASLLPGLLTATRTGLPPASDDEHEQQDHPATSRGHFLFCGAHARSGLSRFGYLPLPLRETARTTATIPMTISASTTRMMRSAGKPVTVVEAADDDAEAGSVRIDRKPATRAERTDTRLNKIIFFILHSLRDYLGLFLERARATSNKMPITTITATNINSTGNDPLPLVCDGGATARMIEFITTSPRTYKNH